MIDDTELWAVFTTESEEQVQRLEDGLLRLQKNPQDSETLKNICGDVHSLKGSAQMMDAQDVAQFASLFDHTLKAARQGEIVLNRALIHRLYGQLNTLRQLIEESASAKPSGVQTEPPLPQVGRRKQPMILLVEDTETVRIRIQRILENGGYQVVTAVDGLDALNKLEDHPFAGVMTDLEMPNMDGLTLIRKIRTAQRFSKLPVIIMTSLSSEADFQRGLEAGANAYLTKSPSDRERILYTWSKMLEKKTA